MLAGEQGITWQKIPFLLEELANYEAILHIDDDAVVAQLEQPVEALLDAYPNRDWFLSAVETKGRKFQGSPKTGVFIVRNTTFVHGMLQQLLSAPECAQFRNMTTCCREQDCLWQLMTRRESIVTRFRRNSGKFGFLMAADFDCRDDSSYHSTIHYGACKRPFAFHGMGTGGWAKARYISQKAAALLPIASRTDWVEGRANLTNGTVYSSGSTVPSPLWGCSTWRLCRARG